MNQSLGLFCLLGFFSQLRASPTGATGACFKKEITFAYIPKTSVSRYSIENSHLADVQVLQAKEDDELSAIIEASSQIMLDGLSVRANLVNKTTVVFSLEKAATTANPTASSKQTIISHAHRSGGWISPFAVGTVAMLAGQNRFAGAVPCALAGLAGLTAVSLHVNAQCALRQPKVILVVPSAPTNPPTFLPTLQPTNAPTNPPTFLPTLQPTNSPTRCQAKNIGIEFAALSTAFQPGANASGFTKTARVCVLLFHLPLFLSCCICTRRHVCFGCLCG